MRIHTNIIEWHKSKSKLGIILLALSQATKPIEAASE
jgi:hypothetical protein